jgi:hypothetical protein
MLKKKGTHELVEVPWYRGAPKPSTSPLVHHESLRAALAIAALENLDNASNGEHKDEVEGW